MSTKIPKYLNLKEFMVRQEVLKLYREIFRTIRKVPDPATQSELKSWARYDFQTNKHHKDEIIIKMLMKSANRSLTELKTSLTLSGCDSSNDDNTKKT